MPGLKINADELIMAMQNYDPDLRHYVNLETGEVFPIFRGRFKDEFPDQVDEDTIADDDRYRLVEPLPSRTGYEIMREFAERVHNPVLRDRLEHALERSRPFRRFKDVLLDYPPEREQWFHHEEERMMEAARDWLRDEMIEAELVQRVTPPPGADASA